MFVVDEARAGRRIRNKSLKTCSSHRKMYTLPRRQTPFSFNLCLLLESIDLFLHSPSASATAGCWKKFFLARDLYERDVGSTNCHAKSKSLQWYFLIKQNTHKSRARAKSKNCQRIKKKISKLAKQTKQKTKKDSSAGKEKRNSSSSKKKSGEDKNCQLQIARNREHG